MRNVIIYTGVCGYDLFEEAFERTSGYKRIYMKKVPRILRVLKNPIRKDSRGRYYKLVKCSIAPM